MYQSYLHSVYLVALNRSSKPPNLSKRNMPVISIFQPHPKQVRAKTNLCCLKYFHISVKPTDCNYICLFHSHILPFAVSDRGKLPYHNPAERNRTAYSQEFPVALPVMLSRRYFCKSSGLSHRQHRIVPHSSRCYGLLPTTSPTAMSRSSKSTTVPSPRLQSR